MTESLHSTEGKPLTLEQLEIRVKALEKLVIRVLDVVLGKEYDVGNKQQELN